jgi:acetyl-CoA C-acetyltransferase
VPVSALSRSPDGLPRELSDRIGAKPKKEAYTWVGASAQKWFVNRTSERIRKDQARLASICGGEPFYSRKSEAKTKGGGTRMTGDLRDPVTSREAKYELMLPLHFYPRFENALRHHEGMSVKAQREELGSFCSRLSSVASQNPYA